MYPNLNAERARNGITMEDIAKAIDKSVGTVYQKLSGNQPITLNEAAQIKKCVNTTLPLEILFSTEAIKN